MRHTEVGDNIRKCNHDDTIVCWSVNQHAAARKFVTWPSGFEALVNLVSHLSK